MHVVPAVTRPPARRRPLFRRAAVAPVVATLLAVAAGVAPQAAAAVPAGCTPVNSAAYVDRVNTALAATTDTWGQAQINGPEGPTFAGAASYLNPLAANANNSGTDLDTTTGLAYSVLGQPDLSASSAINLFKFGQNSDVALHVIDGSEFFSNVLTATNANLNSNQVLLKVGSTSEVYGSCIARSQLATLSGGSLPVLDTQYTDVDGVQYSQESFSDRLAQLPGAGNYGNLVSFIKVTASKGAATVNQASVKFAMGNTADSFDAANVRVLDNTSAGNPNAVDLIGSSGNSVGFTPGSTRDAASLNYTLDLSDGLPHTVYAVRLNTPTSSVGTLAADSATYQAALTHMTTFWNNLWGQAATFSVPDAHVMNAQKVLQQQALQIGVQYSLGNNYQGFPYIPEDMWPLNALGQYGYSDAEYTGMATLRDYTENGRPNFDDLFKGQKMQSAAEWYWRTRDTARFDAQFTSTFAGYAQDFLNQVNADPNGLLQKEFAVGDLSSSPCYALDYNQAHGWAGLAAVVAVWRQIGNTTDTNNANTYAPLVARLGQNLRNAIASSSSIQPDGSLFVPECLLNSGPTGGPQASVTNTTDGSYWNIVMPDAFASGLVAPGSTQAQEILQYLDNHGSRLLGNLRLGAVGGTETSGADNVYLYNTARFLADNDQAEQVGLSLYGLLAAGMSPNTFLAGESSSIAPSTTHYYRDSLRPPNATETGNGLELLHQTLIHTVIGPSGTADEGKPTGLQLAYFTPRSWLETGRQVSVSGAPTAFGALTYSLNATSNQTVQGSVTVPQYYTTATPLQLRIRRTAGLNMTGVTVNGAAWSNVDLASGTITLTGAAPGATLTINASFGSSTTAPSVTSISPSTGSAGQTVTVAGTNLSGGAVDFGTEAVAGATCSATSCQAVVPAGSGVVDVTVTTAGGTSVTSTADRFTYSSSGSTPAPIVAAISPASGPAAGGTAVTVTGTNLTGGTVKFGSVAATGVSCTSTSCAATSPAGSGTVDVTVTTAGGTSATSASDRFTYGTSGTAPTVSAVSPSSGPAAGGTSVTVTGTNLSGGSVKFGAVAATGVTCSATSCTAASPSGSGAVDVTVTTGAGTSATSAADVFTYSAASGAPTLTVTSVSQSSGNVSFTWTAVSGASSYNLYATTTSGSGYFLYASGFTGTSGTAYGFSSGTWYFVLRAVSGGAESANSNEVSANFTNGTTPPVVTGISPASGPAAGGTVVTVSGNNLTGGTVKFGSMPATAVSCASASCTATSPAGSGTVDVTVTTTGGSSATSTSDRFTYAAGTAPAVSGISPTSGPSAGGTSVTVTGTNLSGGTVKFGAVAATGVSCTATSCTATSPAGSGTVDVTVTTGAGTSATSTADVFSYTSSSGAPTNLTVTAINHTSGNVSMTWTPVAGASSYNIYATTTSGSGYFLYSQGLTGTSGTAYGLSVGTWYFVLRAVSGGVESSNSNQVTAVI